MVVCLFIHHCESLLLSGKRTVGNFYGSMSFQHRCHIALISETENNGQYSMFCHFKHIVFSLKLLSTSLLSMFLYILSLTDMGLCRYKKLLCMVDLTKDFYYSYSYNVMRSFQKNMCDNQTGQVLYETMFVWNEFLTRGIRSILQNTIWTVALVYGSFEQVICCSL